jgi:TM2 domain-containing membrane protein YozV
MGSGENNTQYWGSRSLSGQHPGAPRPSAPPSAFTASQGTQPEGQPYRQQVSRSAQPYAGYRSGKDHIVAGLLAIFLGGLGIHKFYLGYHSVGFIMLGVTILGSIFTIGLAGLVMEVIGIVEGITYLSKDQQTFDSTYVYGMKEWF